MRLFLDSSVLLAACGSSRGASREIFRLAEVNDWLLITIPYVVGEVVLNLSSFPLTASSDWAALRSKLRMRDDVTTIDRPAIFEASKDIPILFSALAWADVLLTLDRSDFQTLIGGEFYGMPVLTPGVFLERERKAKRLKIP